jgi:His/Glu/Gln/Arg/opine family amino acid ABC transporter permease subunit
VGFFNSENFRQALALYLQRLPDAALVTLYVTAGAVAIGMALGLLLVLARLASAAWLARSAQATTLVLRAIPAPPFLYLVYFGVISTLGPMEPAICGMVALGVLLTPYMSEIYRSGIQSVRRGYIEAGLAMGMSDTRIRQRIILPIAIRLLLPAIGAQVVVTLLNSSFVSVMGGKDITGMSRNIIYSWFSSELYFIVAVTYFIISYPMSRAVSWLERRLSFQQ